MLQELQLHVKLCFTNTSAPQTNVTNTLTVCKTIRYKYLSCVYKCLQYTFDIWEKIMSNRYHLKATNAEVSL